MIHTKNHSKLRSAGQKVSTDLKPSKKQWAHYLRLKAVPAKVKLSEGARIFKIPWKVTENEDTIKVGQKFKKYMNKNSVDKLARIIQHLSECVQLDLMNKKWTRISWIVICFEQAWCDTQFPPFGFSQRACSYVVAAYVGTQALTCIALGIDMYVQTWHHSMKASVVSLVCVLECIQFNACIGLLCYMDVSLHAGLSSGLEKRTLTTKWCCVFENFHL